MEWRRALANLPPKSLETCGDGGDELVDRLILDCVARLVRHRLVQDGVEHPESGLVRRLAVGGVLAVKFVDGGRSRLATMTKSVDAR